MATYKNLRKVLNLPTLSASPSSGVNGEMYFNTGDSALYIYEGEWKKSTQSAIPLPDWTASTQQAKVQASDKAASDRFGDDVAIDGNTMAIGAFGIGEGAGAVYVFTRSGTTWSQQAKIQSSDIAAGDLFGLSVGVAGDTIVVGAYGEGTGGANAGSAYVFTRSGTTWSQQAKIQSSDVAATDRFGSSVSISSDTVVVGAYGEDTGGSDAGAAYVFTRSGTTWSQQAKIQASDKASGDEFAISVAIDGDTVVVGAQGEDTGASSAGAAYVFTRSGTSWSQQAKIQSSDPQEWDNFGNFVAISSDTVVVAAYGEDTGASGAGAAYVFTRSGTSWSQQAKIQASDAQASDLFGYSAAITGDTVVVAARDEDAGGSNAGAAYVFTRSGTSWTQAKKLVASDAQASDRFGYSVSISGETVVVGARQEDTGVTDAGAAYTFIAG